MCRPRNPVETGVCEPVCMFEIADRLLAAVDAGRRLAVATAVSIEGSAPRTVGTSMAWDGESVIGSIAGGCVEGAVVEASDLVLSDGLPRTVEYGVSDETALSVGLTCGGQLRIHIQLLGPELADNLRHRRPIVITCDGDEPLVFVDEPVTPRHMVIFGAMEFSAALSRAAQVAGYRVTVCDPRPLFATAARFAGAEVVVEWPTTWLPTIVIDERTSICILSHDARFDSELIAQALSSKAGYIGAMGSRTTHDKRVASLRDLGVTDLERLHSPIGLDIGSSTVEETAIAILAEIIAARTGRVASPLRMTAGAIHRVTA
jgi:xanthine dehydrogenase accessory factor